MARIRIREANDNGLYISQPVATRLHGSILRSDVHGAGRFHKAMTREKMREVAATHVFAKARFSVYRTQQWALGGDHVVRRPAKKYEHTQGDFTATDGLALSRMPVTLKFWDRRLPGIFVFLSPSAEIGRRQGKGCNSLWRDEESLPKSAGEGFLSTFATRLSWPGMPKWCRCLPCLGPGL